MIVRFGLAGSVIHILTTPQILRDCIVYTEYRRAKTVTINDVSSGIPVFIIKNTGEILI